MTQSVLPKFPDPANLPAGLDSTKIIYELRGLWARAKPVALVLTDRCLVQVVKGPLKRIAPTGAFVVVEGWEIPTDEILSVTVPTRADLEAHQQAIAEAAYFAGEDHL
ncbi:MAG: hypothetical protein ABW167_07675 [Baekduia sp.]